MHSKRGTDVMDDHPDIRGPGIGRHLTARQFDDQLAIRSHRVTRWHRYDPHLAKAGGRLSNRLNVLVNSSLRRNVALRVPYATCHLP